MNWMQLRDWTDGQTRTADELRAALLGMGQSAGGHIKQLRKRLIFFIDDQRAAQGDTAPAMWNPPGETTPAPAPAPTPTTAQPVQQTYQLVPPPVVADTHDFDLERERLERERDEAQARATDAEAKAKAEADRAREAEEEAERLRLSAADAPPVHPADDTVATRTRLAQDRRDERDAATAATQVNGDAHPPIRPAKREDPGTVGRKSKLRRNIILFGGGVAAVLLLIWAIGATTSGDPSWPLDDDVRVEVLSTDEIKEIVRDEVNSQSNNGLTEDQVEQIVQDAVKSFSDNVPTTDEIKEIVRDEVKNIAPVVTATPAPTATATPEPTATVVPTQVPTASPTASPEPTVTANPTVAPTATTEPTTQPTVKSTPDPGSMPSFDELPGFNPVRDFQQVCGPEQANPCIWDVGTEGIHYDVLGRDVIQVGIAKGVLIEWDEGNLKADPGPTGFCSLVVLTPNSWFENLTVHDAHVATYDVDARDVATWMKVLAVQAAQEQHADYGCPEKTFEEIPQWGSPIPSPPCGVEGWANCSSDASSAPSTTPTSVPTTSDAPDTASCETVNCMARRGTAVDCNGKCAFKAGEAVTGYTITMSDGTVYHLCFIEKATQDGFVIDGVVNPWKAEAADDRKCDV